jgi:hypothetical protein
MTGDELARVLEDGWSVADWCRLLNRLVFFFPTERAALEMAAAYRDRPQVLLRLRTTSLATSYGTLLKVATMNTGSTSRGAAHKMGEFRGSWQHVTWNVRVVPRSVLRRGSSSRGSCGVCR